MNATDWLLRGAIFGFVIGVTLTLLCGVVLAGDDHDTTGMGGYVGGELCGSATKSGCEQKMAEAMKLIQPYIDSGEVVSFTDTLYRSPQTRLREEADRLDKQDAALRRWEAVMRECVK